MRVVSGQDHLRRQSDPQGFGLYDFAKAAALTTLPAKVPANLKKIRLLLAVFEARLIRASVSIFGIRGVTNRRSA